MPGNEYTVSNQKLDGGKAWERDYNQTIVGYLAESF